MVPTSFRSRTAMPAASSRCVDSLELDTAPVIAMPLAASASMNKFTVEPVPTPSTLPASTNSSAARAAACFPVFCELISASPLIVVLIVVRQKRQCPLEAGIVFEFCGERESLSLAWHKAEELLLLGFLLGLFLGFRHG